MSEPSAIVSVEDGETWGCPNCPRLTLCVFILFFINTPPVCVCRKYAYLRKASVRGVGPIGAWIQTEGPPRTAALPLGVKLILLVDNREVRTQTDRTYMQVGAVCVLRASLPIAVQFHGNS